MFCDQYRRQTKDWTANMNLAVYLIVAVFLAELNFSLITAEDCYVGKRSGSSIHTWSYTLTPRDPCDCTRLILTSNTEQLILSEDINTVRRFLAVNCPDQEPPVLTCPDVTTPATVYWDFDGSIRGQLIYEIHVVDNSKEDLQAKCVSWQNGSWVPYGSREISCSATDSSGNTGTCRFNATVIDQEPPVLTCLDVTTPATVYWDYDGSIRGQLIYEIHVDDNSKEDLQAKCFSWQNGSWVPYGSREISCSATDSSGNTGTCRFNATVIDIEMPIIYGTPVNIDVNGAGNSSVYWTEPTASDNSGLVTLISSHSPGALFPLGETPVTYTATDASGNSESHTFTITVRDYYRADDRCGPGFLAPNGEEAKCLKRCCSKGDWCGTTVQHCDTYLYKDYRCCEGQSCTECAVPTK